MKKSIVFTISAIVLGSLSAVADYQIPALLSKPNGENFRAWILGATDKQIRYKTSEVSTASTDAKISDFATVYLYEPTEFSDAVDLFEAGKYDAAKESFAKLKKVHEPISPLKNNFHTLSAYYELEAMRKLEEYKELIAALAEFRKGPLTRADHLQQLELYVLWDAVQTEDFDRVARIGAELESEDLPGYQRAQVAYCYAVALKNLKKEKEALEQCHIAMTADAGASAIIAQNAAILALEIHIANSDVKIAMDLWGTKNEDKNSDGYSRLIEAANLVALYDTYFKENKNLPSELKKFSEFSTKKES